VTATPEATEHAAESPSASGSESFAPDVRSRTGALGAALIAVVALGAGVLVHLPGLARPLFDSDEAAIATLAAGLTRGGVLYRDLVDRKPPLAPLVYAGSFLLTGTHSILPVRMLLGFELGIAALLIGVEAKRITGSGRSAWWSGALLIAGAVAFRPIAAQAANYSQLAMFPGCVAIVASRRGTRLGAVVGGVALGLAVLTRQTWLLGLAAAMLAAWYHGDRRVERPLILAGATTVTIGAVGLFAPFGAFWHWTFSGNTDLLAISQSRHVTARLLLSLVPFVLAHVVAIGLAARRGVRRTEVDLWLWLAAGAAAFAIGFRFFDHYWFQALPPLCLLGGLAVPSVRQSVRTLLALLVLWPAAAWWSSAWSAHAFGTDWSPVVAVIRANSGAGDRITVWGAVPELYWLSDRDPGGALVLSDFVVGRTAGRSNGPRRLADAAPGALRTFLSSLYEHPPLLFLDTSTTHLRGYDHYPLRLVPPVDRFVHDYYRQLTTAKGITIWREAKTPPRHPPTAQSDATRAPPRREPRATT
jgi:hypothetical protein